MLQNIVTLHSIISNCDSGAEDFIRFNPHLLDGYLLNTHCSKSWIFNTGAIKFVIYVGYFKDKRNMLFFISFTNRSKDFIYIFTFYNFIRGLHDEWRISWKFMSLKLININFLVSTSISLHYITWSYEERLVNLLKWVLYYVMTLYGETRVKIGSSWIIPCRYQRFQKLTLLDIKGWLRLGL